MKWLNHKLSLLALHLLALVATSTFAADTDFAECRQFFTNNTPPVIQHQEVLQPRALCFSGFAVLHSGKILVNYNKPNSFGSKSSTNQFIIDCKEGASGIPGAGETNARLDQQAVVAAQAKTVARERSDTAKVPVVQVAQQRATLHRHGSDQSNVCHKSFARHPLF